jgi:four helix bundle protein
MAEIKSFEDLIAWQKSKTLCIEVIRLLQKSSVKRNFSFVDQVTRCAISVSSNIAEGYGRKGNKEFLNFLHISQGSLNELLSLFHIWKELDPAKTEEINDLRIKAIEVRKILQGLINHLKSTEMTGSKFVKRV